MAIFRYLPSAQFALIAASIIVSGGLVLAAENYTNKEKGLGVLDASETSTRGADIDWQSTLAEIQLQSGITSPKPPNEESVRQLLEGAQSSNVTDSVARTLLINLSNASAQGLGSDIPTQERLIASALTQVDKQISATYVLTDLTTIPNTPVSLRLYGNAVIAALLAHPRASMADTLFAIGAVVDNNNPTSPLKIIGQEYRALANDFTDIPVPQMLAPLHLQITNNFFHIADVYPDMETLLSDPLRGLAGLQTYQSLTDETTRVLTTIAQQLDKSAILFDKDEPGSAWSIFLPTSL